jgi:hypothetical protein
MKRASVIGAAAAALLVGTLAAQSAQESVDQDMMAKIRDEGQNHSQVGAIFSTLVDVIGPRLTGSPAHKRAAEFMRDSAGEFGLTNAHLESWDFGRGWELDKLTIEMVEPRYMPLIGYAEAWSPATSGELTVSAVSIACKSADDVEAMAGSLANAAVLQSPVVTNFTTVDRVQPATQPDDTTPTGAPRGGGGGNECGAAAGATGGRQAGAARQGGAARGGGAPSNAQRIDAALKNAHAAVLLKPSRGNYGTVFVQAASRETPGDTLPKVVLAGEHYNIVARLIDRKIPVKIRVNVQTKFFDPRESYNVIADIPGTDPALKDQIVMLGAHLDSWHSGTGATDNADGAAASLEAFRILKAIGAQPRRTVRLALWGGEEEGLLGSKAYVHDHLEGDAHKADRDKMDVYFNLDPGYGPIYGWYLENNDAVRPIFDAWLAPFKSLGALRNVKQPIGNTDHLSFIAVGIPGFNAIQDYTVYDTRLHHTNADTHERVEDKDLQQNAIVLAAFVYDAAMRTEKVPSPIRPAGGLAPGRPR